MNCTNRANTVQKWAVLVIALSCGAVANSARAITYQIAVDDVRFSIEIPVDWTTLPPDPSYVHWATPDGRKKITFHVRPAKTNETAESCARAALERLRSLDRDVSRGPGGPSLMRDITAGPTLALANETPGAGWLYRVVKPDGRKERGEICYWTVVARRGPLMCYLEMRWAPDANRLAGTRGSFLERLCSQFLPICESLRSYSPEKPIPVAAFAVDRRDKATPRSP